MLRPVRCGGRLFVVACVTLALLGQVGAEETAGPPPEAKKAFTDGKAAYERGDYDSALRLFQRAALIAPAPSLYYNIGMAYERLGRFEDSAIAFERYLELVETPNTDDERAFQNNLRSRAAANRARAHEPTRTAPATPLVEPSPLPGYSRYPQYVYAPYLPSPAPPLTHRQKLDAARRHRNNGIALLSVGAALIGIGTGLTTWLAVAQPFDRSNSTGEIQYGLSMWGATFPLVVGVTFVIPGAVALARWQREYSLELKRPDDHAELGSPTLLRF
jgi:tetratricopeptide (TPR) repeat protein